MRGGLLARYSAATDNFVNADDCSTSQAAERREQPGGGSPRFGVRRTSFETKASVYRIWRVENAPRRQHTKWAATHSDDRPVMQA
jgi:hypothetical protein